MYVITELYKDYVVWVKFNLWQMTQIAMGNKILWSSACFNDEIQ